MRALPMEMFGSVQGSDRHRREPHLCVYQPAEPLHRTIRHNHGRNVTSLSADGGWSGEQTCSARRRRLPCSSSNLPRATVNGLEAVPRGYLPQERVVHSADARSFTVSGHPLVYLRPRSADNCSTRGAAGCAPFSSQHAAALLSRHKASYTFGELSADFCRNCPAEQDCPLQKGLRSTSPVSLPIVGRCSSSAPVSRSLPAESILILISLTIWLMLIEYDST